MTKKGTGEGSRITGEREAGVTKKGAGEGSRMTGQESKQGGGRGDSRPVGGKR